MLLASISMINGNILMDLNEEYSPIFNDDRNQYNDFNGPQLVEIEQFSKPIANEMHNLMDPQWNEHITTWRDSKPLVSRVITDFRNSYENSQFTAHVMSKLRDLYWKKHRAANKIQVIDNFKSNLAKWQKGLAKMQ